VREATDTTRGRPNRFPDAGAYPEHADPATKRTRQIDCSAAHAERESARSAKEDRGHDGHRGHPERRSGADPGA
jgi:hypothetical protein